MIAAVGRMILKRLIASQDIEKKLFDALEARAKRTDTKLDDNAVAVAKEIYDVAIPIIVGEIR
jgi:hypothetical protein